MRRKVIEFQLSRAFCLLICLSAELDSRLETMCLHHKPQILDSDQDYLPWTRLSGIPHLPVSLFLLITKQPVDMLVLV